MNIKYNVNVAFLLSILILIHLDMLFSYLNFNILLRYFLLLALSILLYFIFRITNARDKTKIDSSSSDELNDAKYFHYSICSNDIKAILSQEDTDSSINAYINLMRNLSFVNRIGVRITDPQYFVDKTYGDYERDFASFTPSSTEIISYRNDSICVVPIKIVNNVCGYVFIELIDKCGNLKNVKERIQNTTYFLSFILENQKIIKEYRNNQTYYYKLFNQNHFPMLLVNPENGNIVDCNEAAIKLYGYTREELLALNISSINISSKEYLKSKMSEATLNSTIQFDFRHKLKSGEIINVRVSSGKILIDNNLLLFSIIQDISEEYITQVSFEKFKSIIEQSPNSIIITNLNGDIEYVNPAFVTTTGYSLKDVYSQTPRVLKSGEQPDSLYEQLWEEISKGHTWEGEFINKRKDGSLFYEYAIITMIRDKEDVPLGYLSIETDVSIYKEMNLTLIKKMRHLLDTISQLKNLNPNVKNIIELSVNLKDKS